MVFGRYVKQVNKTWLHLHSPEKLHAAATLYLLRPSAEIDLHVIHSLPPIPSYLCPTVSSSAKRTVAHPHDGSSSKRRSPEDDGVKPKRRRLRLLLQDASSTRRQSAFRNNDVSGQASSIGFDAARPRSRSSNVSRLSVGRSSNPSRLSVGQVAEEEEEMMETMDRDG
ncbi:hypothetical protein M231_04078 [Tremella mesenterica]|uniref:Uncharacterized protein n=1 Tax=Tremella mesenterica TaxID=5217 RepID=A0A4Q1BLJ5_TREME|nr:hypothetical protein M231_04078 [Tremella mesenterica]